MTYASQRARDDSVAKRVYTSFMLLFVAISFLSIPLYIVSRMILLVLAFVELGNVPPGALAPVQWIHYVPFIY